MATARRTATDDLNPKANERIQRMRIERLRKQGKFRELVLWLLGQPEPWQREANNSFETRIVRVRPKWRPTPEDLAGALRESAEPLPEPIREYIIKRHLLQTTQVKPGPLGASRAKADDDRVLKFSRSTATDDRVLEFYVGEYLTALDEHEANEGPETRAVATRAKMRTAQKFGISKSTVESILSQYQLLKAPARK